MALAARLKASSNQQRKIYFGAVTHSNAQLKKYTQYTDTNHVRKKLE